MKKSSNARIVILVLSLALILGAVFCVSAAAEETSDKGTFGSISIAHADKVAIRVEVNALPEEINDSVIVSYTLNGVTKNADYYMTDAQNRVWVITEGISIYDLGQTVTFSSTVNGEQVEKDRTYSVAQFLYKMLYVDETVEENDYNVYKYLLAYGEAAQIAHNKNTDKLVTASTIVYTKNADVTINGMSSAFAPASTLVVTPKWNGTLEEGMSVDGWVIADSAGQRTVDDLTFTCSGVVEIIEPTFYVHTHTEEEPVVEKNVAPECEKEGSYDSVVYCSECGGEVRRETITVDALGHDYSDVAYTWSADNAACTAMQVCANNDSHNIVEVATVRTIVLNVADGKISYTYNVTYENDIFEAQTKVVESDAPEAVGRLVTVNAPTIADRVPSHDYVKFDVEDTKADTFTIYYSECDVWDGTVSESLSGEGTEESPYLIQSGADLAYVAKVVNDAAASTANFKGVYFKMTKSIDLNGKELLIGGYTASKAFHGYFDGNNCVVKGINATQSLFGMLKDGYIKNLSTYGTVTTTEKKGVAGLVSYVSGATVENITNYVNVTGVQQVAGVVGWLENNTTSVAKNCVNYGTVVATSYQIGGIAGFAKGTITGCTNFGDVTSTASGYVGGIGGSANDAKGSRSDCVNYGNISGTDYVGGCFGLINKTTTDCYSYGTAQIINSSKTNVGEVVGGGADYLTYTAE